MRQSREFRRSPGLRRFLAFLVDAALEGRTDEIKESVLGIEVFHRKSAYDEKADPIVRVEANRLRHKLEAYYAKEGVNDLLRISLPSGAYVPVIERRLSPPLEAATPSPAIAMRVLVLPFANLTGQADREFFSDGLTEESIHRLSAAPGLEVLAYTTALALKQTPLDAARLRERFSVDVLLEGGVLLVGDTVRLNLRLISTREGVCIWSGQPERREADAHLLADDLAAVVARELKQRPDAPAPRPGRALAPAVHEAQLLGHYVLHCWGQSNRPILPPTSEGRLSSIPLSPRPTAAWRTASTCKPSGRKPVRPRSCLRPSRRLKERSCWMPLRPTPIARLAFCGTPSMGTARRAAVR